MTRVSRETWDWAESEGFELGQHRVQAKIMVSWCEKTNKQTDKNNLKHKAANYQQLQNCTKVTCSLWLWFSAFLSNCRPRLLKSLPFLTLWTIHGGRKVSKLMHYLYTLLMHNAILMHYVYKFISKANYLLVWLRISPGGSWVKKSTYNAGDVGSIPELGRSLGGRNGNSRQYCSLENSMDRGAWQATVHGIPKSQTWLSNWPPTQKRTLVIESFFYFANL